MTTLFWGAPRSLLLWDIVAVFDLHIDMPWPSNGQLSAFSYPDKSGTDSSTSEEWKVWLPQMENPNLEPGIGSTSFNTVSAFSDQASRAQQYYSYSYSYSCKNVSRFLAFYKARHPIEEVI